MQILETTPQYHRVQMPDGQVLTIARTPGTDALVQSRAGLAGGGVIAPEFLPPQPDEFDLAVGNQQAPLIREVPAELAAQPVVGSGVPQTPAQQALGVAAKMAEPWQTAPTVMDVVGPIPFAGRIAASAGALAGDPAIRGEVESVKGAIAKQVNPVVAAPGEAKAGETEAAPAEGGEKPELDTDLAALMQPIYAQQQATAANQAAANAGALSSLSALDAAQAKMAEEQAKSQEELAAHYASMKLPEAPPNAPVDPGKFYENVGKMFGAANPRSARIIGGIASGLMVGLGEIGAALSHRQNVAAGIIQDAISQSIASQQNAQALTRQQWIDQTQYATEMANRKIAELGAKAKAAEIRNQVPILQATNRLKFWEARTKDGSLTMQQTAPLVKIETARIAAGRVAQALGTTPSGLGAKVAGVKRMVGMESGDTAAANANVDMLNNAFLNAVARPNSNEPLSPEAFKTWQNTLVRNTDSADSKKAKIKLMLQTLRELEQVHAGAVRGQDPKGAGSVTPNARPN